MTIKWYFLWFKYPVDYVLDKQINHLVNCDIDKIVSSENGNWLYINFTNGTELKIWNRGKYQSWMSRGEIQNAGRAFQYSWRRGRAKRKNMFQLLLKIQRHSKQTI